MGDHLPLGQWASVPPQEWDLQRWHQPAPTRRTSRTKQLLSPSMFRFFSIVIKSDHLGWIKLARSSQFNMQHTRFLNLFFIYFNLFFWLLLTTSWCSLVLISNFIYTRIVFEGVNVIWSIGRRSKWIKSVFRQNLLLISLDLMVFTTVICLKQAKNHFI